MRLNHCTIRYSGRSKESYFIFTRDRRTSFTFLTVVASAWLLRCLYVFGEEWSRRKSFVTICSQSDQAKMEFAKTWTNKLKTNVRSHRWLFCTSLRELSSRNARSLLYDCMSPMTSQHTCDTLLSMTFLFQCEATFDLCRVARRLPVARRKIECNDGIVRNRFQFSNLANS